jgi:predicted nucleotidyltransferase
MTKQNVSRHGAKVTPELIDELRRQIVEAIEPHQIVLFGSQARGNAQPDSDIDLLIVHDRPETDCEIRLRLDRLFLRRRFGLDMIVRTVEEVAMNLADHNPFYTETIYGQGRILYER